MTAEVIGEAQVLITADFSTFDDELRAKLTNAARKAGNDAEKILKRSGDRGGKAFSDGVSKAAASQKTLDSIRGAVERLEAASVRAGDAQVDSANKVARAEAALQKVKRTTSTVTLDGAEKIIAAEARVAKAKRDAARADTLALNASKALSSARAKLAVEGSRAGDAFGDELSKAVRKSSSRAGDDSGNFFSRAFRTAASKSIGQGLFRGLLVSAGGLLTALSPLSTVLGGATAAIVALAAALATASGSAISLAGVLGSLGLAAVTLKVGFSGLGDAMDAQSKAQQELATTGKISEATQQKLDAALKNLAPSARAVVKELGAMAPAWQAVTRSVQQRLFVGVGTALAALGNRYLPILTQQLGTAAATLNQTAQGFGRFLNTSTRAGQISTIFSGLNSILRTLLAPATTLAGAFLNVFQASLPFAQQLANVLSSLTVSFAGFLNQAVKSGSFNTFMQTAMTLAGNLFQLLGNIGSIIGSVFAAGTATGGNLLVILRNVTGQFAQFLKSAAGQQALTSFFGLIGQAASVLVGIFKTLSPLLAGIGAVFSALQPAIAAVGKALQPVILALSTQLGATLSQLAPLLATLVSTGIGPLAAALGGVLVTAVQGLTPILMALVQGLTALAPGLTVIATVISGVLAGAFQVLGPLISQLLVTLGQLLGSYLTAIAPVLQVLAGAILQLLAPIAQLVQGFLTVIQAFIPLLPALGQLNALILQIVLAFLPLVTTILQLFADQMTKIAPIIAQAVPWLAQVIAFLTRFAAAVLPVITNIVIMGTNIIRIFAAIDIAILGFVVRAIGSFTRFVVTVIAAGIRLGVGVVRAISSMVSSVTGFFSSLVGTVAGHVARFALAVKGGVDKAIAFFRELPGKVAAAVSGLASALFTAGSQAVAGLVNGIKSKAGEVLAAAQDLAGKVKSGIGNALKIFSPSRVTTSQGEDAGQGLANGILNKVRTVGRAAADLANAVPSAISKALTKVNSSLISLSNALPAGAKRRIDAVVSAGKTQFAVLAKASDALDAKFKASQTKLQDLLQKSQQLATSVAQAVLQTGDITKGQDTSFRGIITGLTTAVANARQFTKVIAALQKSGLNSTSLQQIIAAGPEQGAAIGQSILNAGRAGINQVNKLQTQLQTAANQAAKSAANAIFGQGIALAKGVVAGLAQQRANLNKQMTQLADVLVLRILKLLQALKLPGVNTLKIPGLKDGGVVNGVPGAAGTLIRAGEYGRKEAVIPLERPKRARELMDSTGLSALVAAGKGGKSKTVEVPIHVAGNVVDYDALVAHLEKVFQKYGLVPKLGIVTAGGAL